MREKGGRRCGLLMGAGLASALLQPSTAARLPQWKDNWEPVAVCFDCLEANKGTLLLPVVRQPQQNTPVRRAKGTAGGS